MHDGLVEVGVDEAGRGPLFGRVYTAAVVLPTTGLDYGRIKDSKKFNSFKKLKEVAEYIRANAVAWAVTWSDEKQIDDENILNATMDSMHRSIDEVQKKEKNVQHVLVDGNYFKPHPLLPHTCVERGDNTYCCIAAASILAKVARDTYIDELCAEHPYLDEVYHMRKHKGYGTKLHMEILAEHGPTPWHRMSFGPCDPKKEKKTNYRMLNAPAPSYPLVAF
jgi:ribonuclease HII